MIYIVQYTPGARSLAKLGGGIVAKHWYFDEYEKWLADRYREKTVITYAHGLRLFRRWFGRGDVTKVTAAVVDDYVTYCLEQDLQQTTINTYVNAVSMYFEYLAEKGLVQGNPVLKRHKKTVYLHPPTRFSDEQIAFALGWLSECPNNVYAVFLTMFATGCRIDEAASLFPADFQEIDGILHIDIRDAKYGSDRIIPFLQMDYAVIVKEYLQGVVVPDLPVFRLAVRTIQRYAQYVSEEFGFHFFCHRIRHTVAEIMIERGYSLEQVQGQLGHENIRVTSYYAKSNKEIVYKEDLYESSSFVG